MFPLGSVLFPHMPVALRVFEERYLVMLSKILHDEPSEFGIVLIERGQEVGGGEQRFSHATVAQITQLDAGEQMVGLVALGERRVEIVSWLEEDPFPHAVVKDVAELVWSDDLQPLRDRAERAVRRAISLASEFAELQWPADVQLSEDPVAAAWQLAAIAPIGPLDQVKLLRATSMESLLTELAEVTGDVDTTFRPMWPDQGSAEGDSGADPNLGTDGGGGTDPNLGTDSGTDTDTGAAADTGTDTSTGTGTDISTDPDADAGRATGEPRPGQ